MSHTFEIRYFSNEKRANGITDFKGKTEFFNTDQRVDYLRFYSEFAKQFFNDPDLDKQVINDSKIQGAISGLKPQPQPVIRQRVNLQKWKWLGYKSGQRQKEQEQLGQWRGKSGIVIDSLLRIKDTYKELSIPLGTQTWRFFIRFRVKPNALSLVTINLKQEEQTVCSFGFDQSGHIYHTDRQKKITDAVYDPDTWYTFKAEVDLHNAHRYNLYINDELIADYVPLMIETDFVNTIQIDMQKGAFLDDLWGVGYDMLHESFRPTKIKQSPNVLDKDLAALPMASDAQKTYENRRPFSIKTFLDQDFSVPTDIKGWQTAEYNDSAWKSTQLPHVHGGERYAGQDLYLRKTIEIGDFERAVLNSESLDPGGEIWVNGHIVKNVRNRRPQAIDVTPYLEKHSENLIAVRVPAFAVQRPMGHTPYDFNIGWFAGRMHVDLLSKKHINDVFVHTTGIDNPVHANTRISLENSSRQAFTGSIKVQFKPWFPQKTGEWSGETQQSITLLPWEEKSVTLASLIKNPRLWSVQNPNLYKVHVILQNQQGTPIDDYIVTTGLRTITQKNGNLQINGNDEILRGAQIMGYRAPLDKVAAWNRCAPLDWLVREALMIKAMGGNMMRIHVHAWMHAARNINDPRLAEIGDQLGLIFIWPTTAWVRTATDGSSFGIDLEGYPQYMRQVYNHPSIAIWEVSNHLHGFAGHDVEKVNDYFTRVYDTLYPVDPSRLIAPSANMTEDFPYGNDTGTRDKQGRSIQACTAFTAPGITRGNMSQITGKGNEWSLLRKWPPPVQKIFLNSTERAYFDFEHQESIGQPNWSLRKGKPSYHIHSYEWWYDIGSIGRRLEFDEWQESQAWQAFSAYESMRKERLLGYDGFSWCCLHGGPNTATYWKPLIDFYGHAKLSFYINRMAFQDVLAGSDNVDIVYGPDDTLKPVIMNVGKAVSADLSIVLKNKENKVIYQTTYKSIQLPKGRTKVELNSFNLEELQYNGFCSIEYIVITKQE
ncbi:MAG: glycosyl hydrolase family 2 [candidate division KSB1 bacterium]|nr:glycosyl hydrolase family 2 [candidate division KSB1 bacterium]